MKRYILIILALIFSLNIYAEKLAVLPEVLKPEFLVIDGNRIYVTSETLTVYMYSMDDYKFLKKFIKKGEGPKEAKARIHLTAFPDKLIATSRGKVMFFSRDGEYINEKRTAKSTYRVSPMGKNFIGNVYNVDGDAGSHYYSIDILDNEMNPIKTLRKGEDHNLYTSTEGKKKKIFKVIHDQLLYDIYDGKIYMVDTQRGFSITVFDGKGNQLYEINKDYKKIEVPESFKKDWLKRAPGFEKVFHVSFREYFPAINNFWVKNGKIYVFSFEKKEEGDRNKRELVVLDLKGEILTRVFVHDDVLKSTTHNGKFYYLFENEDEEVWELHAEEIK